MISNEDQLSFNSMSTVTDIFIAELSKNPVVPGTEFKAHCSNTENAPTKYVSWVATITPVTYLRMFKVVVLMKGLRCTLQPYAILQAIQMQTHVIHKEKVCVCVWVSRAPPPPLRRHLQKRLK